MNKRYGHSAVIYNESMYIFGGYDDFGLSCNDLWEFNFGEDALFYTPDTDTTQTCENGGAFRHLAVPLNDIITLQ